METVLLSDLASATPGVFDAREWQPSSPAVASQDHVSLTRWVAALASADMIGSISMALLIFRLYAGPLNYDPMQLWVGVSSFVVGWIFAARTQGLYSKKTLLAGARALALQGLIACALAFGIVLLLGFALKFIGTMSRVWLLTWAAGVFCWVGSLRILWAHYLRRLLRRGLCLDRALVLAGSLGQAEHVGDDLERESRGQIGVVSATAIPGTPYGPSIDWVEDAIRRGMIDRVIVARFEDAVAQSNTLLARLARVSVDVTLIPDLAGLQAPVLRVDRIGMLPTIDLALRPLSAIEAALKRAEDLCLSGLILLLMAPVFIAVALAIKLDSPGPVLFGQLREGYHNRVIKVWKFRTMYYELRDDRAMQQTSKNDSRVTRVGRLLRRLSLDELPQFINVIRGEMSIVGPRPHALGMTSVGLPMTQVLEGYTARHRLKPGITGWAQVNGCRGEVDSHEKLHRRVSLDCHYIDHWSLSFDLWIILRTFALVLFDADAY